MEIKISPNAKEKKPKYDEWTLKCKADVLMEAEEIKQDKELMAALAPLLDKKVRAVESIDDIRARAQKLANKLPDSSSKKTESDTEYANEEPMAMPEPPSGNEGTTITVT